MSDSKFLNRIDKLFQSIHPNFEVGDEVIVYVAKEFDDLDEHGFGCIKLSDGNKLYRNNVLIVDEVLDSGDLRCHFKKFSKDQPDREVTVPAKYLRHTAKNLEVGSKVRFIPGVRCVQSGKVGTLVKITETPKDLQFNEEDKNELTYWFERDDKKGSYYPCKSHDLIEQYDTDLVETKKFSSTRFTIRSIGYHAFKHPHHDRFEVYDLKENKAIYSAKTLDECKDYCEKNNLNYDLCIAKGAYFSVSDPKELDKRIVNLICRRNPVGLRESDPECRRAFLSELCQFGFNEVDTKWEPPEGLFKDGSSLRIAREVWESHDKDLKRSIACINFYLNRAGKNLSKERIDVLEAAKDRLYNWDEKEHRDFSAMTVVSENPGKDSQYTQVLGVDEIKLQPNSEKLTKEDLDNRLIESSVKEHEMAQSNNEFLSRLQSIIDSKDKEAAEKENKEGTESTDSGEENQEETSESTEGETQEDTGTEENPDSGDESNDSSEEETQEETSSEDTQEDTGTEENPDSSEETSEEAAESTEGETQEETSTEETSTEENEETEETSTDEETSTEGETQENEEASSSESTNSGTETNEQVVSSLDQLNNSIQELKKSIDEISNPSTESTDSGEETTEVTEGEIESTESEDNSESTEDETSDSGTEEQDEGETQDDEEVDNQNGELKENDEKDGNESVSDEVRDTVVSIFDQVSKLKSELGL